MLPNVSPSLCTSASRSFCLDSTWQVWVILGASTSEAWFSWLWYRFSDVFWSSLDCEQIHEIQRSRRMKAAPHPRTTPRGSGVECGRFPRKLQRHTPESLIVTGETIPSETMAWLFEWNDSQFLPCSTTVSPEAQVLSIQFSNQTSSSRSAAFWLRLRA